MNYGARGWVAHHNTTVAQTAPVGDSATAIRCGRLADGGGVALAAPVGAFRVQRRREIPARPRLSVMKARPSSVSTGSSPTRRAISSRRPRRRPSTSSAARRRHAAVSLACTMDWRSSGICSPTCSRQRRTERRRAFARALRRAAKLIPYQVGSERRDAGMGEGLRAAETEHRHISHLFGVHPGPRDHAGARRRCSPPRARRWRCAAMAARAGRWRGRSILGADAGRRPRLSGCLTNLLKPVRHAQSRVGGGVYSEPLRRASALPDRRQLRRDGGNRRDAGAEPRREIDLLPALPRAWPAGTVSGLRARGGVEVEIEWAGGTVRNVAIRSKLGGVCRVRSAAPFTVTGGYPCAPASGPSANPFYRVHPVARPIVASGAQLPRVVAPTGTTWSSRPRQEAPTSCRRNRLVLKCYGSPSLVLFFRAYGIPVRSMIASRAPAMTSSPPAER